MSPTCTGIVALPEEPPELDGLDVVATVPTEDTTPGVLVPFGSVTLTASPDLTSDWSEASRLMVTTCRSEVAVSTGPVAGSPRCPVTWETRSASGSNTTCPSDSDAGGEEIPRCSFSRCTA